MKKPMLALLAVFTCTALAPQFVRADDGPDLKETMKWLKKYLNEAAGGQFGDDLPADAPSKATGPSYSFSYKWIDKPFTSAGEATADGQLSLTNRADGTVYQYKASVRLKNLKPDALEVGQSEFFKGAYYLSIPGKEAVTVTKDGEPVDMDGGIVFFPTEDAAKKACRALRRAALLAGAGDVADPFAEPMKDPFVSRPSVPTPPITPSIPTPTPDDKAARRADLDSQIAAASSTIGDYQQQLSDLDGKIIGAKLGVAAAQAAYDRSEDGSLDQIVAAGLLATAQGVLDEFVSQREGIAGDLQSERQTLNELKRQRSRLGN